MNRRQKKAKVLNAQAHRAAQDDRFAQRVAKLPASGPNLSALAEEAKAPRDNRVFERVTHEETKIRGTLRKAVVKVMTGQR